MQPNNGNEICSDFDIDSHQINTVTSNRNSFIKSRTFFNSNVNYEPATSVIDNTIQNNNLHLNSTPLFSPFSIQNEIIVPRSLDSKTKWPLSTNRTVTSVSTQTVNPIKLMCESTTQTNIPDDDCIFVKSLEYLLHTEKEQPVLPIIQLAINKIPENFLLDSGASISLLSLQFFQNVKDCVHYSRIASNVKISTVNSAVICSGCINLSFKIGKVFYKHTFFLIDIPEHSKFVGILGFDFLKTHHVVIDLHNNQIKINSNLLEIFDTVSDQEIVDNSDVQINTISSQNVHSPVSAISNCNSESSSSDCFLKKKVVIPPKCTVYVAAVSSFLSDSPQLLFEPSRNESPTCSLQAVVNVDAIPKSKANKNSTFQFFIPVTNNSDENIHLNKGKILGNIHEISEIQESTNIDSPLQQLNLIQASPDVIKLRQSEFKIEDFQLDHLSLHQKDKLQNLLSQYNTVFSSSMKSLGHTDRVRPHIQFISDVPVKTLPFPVPQAIQEAAKQQLDMLMEAGIIERNISEWSCPMLMVKKKPASPNEKPKFRMALDLRLINSMIRGSSYPLPRIDTIINNISKYKFFTTLDFCSAYHQIDLPEEFRKRLAFTTEWGTYSFSRLMFGLKSAASSFQMLIDNIIEEGKLQGVYAYQDDIIVASDTFEEMVDKLKALFTILQKYNLTLSPPKCRFHLTAVDYLGFHIEDHTISPLTSNITKVNSFPTPRTKKHLKRFIGLCGFYRRLIPNYSKLLDPLIKLTSPKVPFSWTEVHDEHFKKIQKVFFSKPFLSLPDWSKPFFLNTDASGVAIAGVLLQERDGNLLPVSYFSKTLSNSEKRYPALKLELMAIVKSVNAFKFFLYNRPFTILSDSKPLEYYRKTTSPVDLTTRWLIDLHNYDFTFKYVKGNTNVLADYFSREDFQEHTESLYNNPNIIKENNILPITTSSPTIELHHITTQNSEDNESISNKDDTDMQISRETFLIEQRNDDKIMKIIDSITSEEPDPRFKNFFIHPDTGLLMVKRKFNLPENHKSCKIVVPHCLKSKVLKICHMPHFGIGNTYRNVLKNYYWSGIFKDTRNFVLSCTLCITHKPHRIPKAPLQEMFIPSMPGELVSMDFVGPFTNGFHVLTFLDHFSKHMELFPIKNPTSQAVVNSLTKYITNFGRPASLMSDLGSQFTSKVFNNFTQSLKISLIHSSSGHPQTQGSSERINTSIKSSIATLAKEGYNFKQAIMIHKNLYNTTIHSSTGYSPSFLHFGRSLSNIFDLYEYPNLEALSYPYEYYSFMSSMKHVYQKVFKSMKLNQQNRNSRQHQSANLRKFKIGDIVFIKSKDTFKPRYIGPYTVIQVPSSVNIKLQDSENETAEPFIINIDRVLLAQKRFQHLISQPTFKIVNNSNNNNSNNSASHPYFLRSCSKI